MHPVRAQVINEVNGGADGPGEGIGPVDVADLADEMDHEHDVDDADDTPDREHDHHRHDRTARAAADGGDGVREGEQTVEERHRARLLHTEGDNAGRTVEERDELARPYVVAQADQLGHDDGEEDAEARAAPGAVILLGAEVLPDEGGAGHRKARDGQESKALDLAVRAVGGHGEHTEGVDLRLDNDVGKADDAVLHAGGKTVADDLAEHGAVEADVARRDGIDLALFEQVNEAERAARALRDDGRHGGGPHAPAEHADEENIERDVDERGNDEVVQRAAAVAKGVQNARAHIVEHRCQHAEEVVAKVFDRLRHDLRVGIHPDEERRCEEYADDRQQRAGDDAESEVRMDGARDIFVVARAEVLGDGDARAHGRTDEETREQHDERAGRADGGEGVRAEVLSHDESVGRAVKLLN